MALSILWHSFFASGTDTERDGWVKFFPGYHRLVNYHSSDELGKAEKEYDFLSVPYILKLFPCGLGNWQCQPGTPYSFFLRPRRLHRGMVPYFPILSTYILGSQSPLVDGLIYYISSSV